MLPEHSGSHTRAGPQFPANTVGDRSREQGCSPRDPRSVPGTSQGSSSTELCWHYPFQLWLSQMCVFDSNCLIQDSERLQTAKKRQIIIHIASQLWLTEAQAPSRLAPHADPPGSAGAHAGSSIPTSPVTPSLLGGLWVHQTKPQPKPPCCGVCSWEQRCALCSCAPGSARPPRRAGGAVPQHGNNMQIQH